MKKIIKKYSWVLLALLVSSCSEEGIDESGLGTITGTIVNQGNNVPLSNVKISTSPVSNTVFTDEDGAFTIPNVTAGNYSVQAQLDGFLSSFKAANVVTGRTSNVVFELQVSTANNRPPLPPKLIAPADNEILQNIEANFLWSASDPDDDELTYTLELRNDQIATVEIFEEISDTTFTFTPLIIGAKYFWQVTADDGINTPIISSVSSFEVMGVPIDNRLLFTRTMNGNNVIFSADEDGTEFQLTSSNTNSFRPRKNNSTDKIAFLRTVGGQTQLFTMNLDGSEQFQVTSSIPVNGFNMDKVDFSWANDGASLVYPNFEKLYSIQATGGGNTLIYQAPSGRFITEVDVSEDNTLLALLTNNAQGYNASIYTIDTSGNVMDSVIAGLPGALGGIDISVDKKRLLFTRDVSGFENSGYRQLDSRLFLYNFGSNMSVEISYNKEEGTNDLDPRFSPDEAEVIFVNTSNDGLSEPNIYKSQIEDNQTQNGNNRQELYQNAMMPDWE